MLPEAPLEGLRRRLRYLGPVTAAFCLLASMSCGGAGGTDLAFDVRFAGDFCGQGFREYVAMDDARILLLIEEGNWTALIIADGDVFDPESEAGWRSTRSTATTPRC